jgi:hypothetical protein
MPWLLLLILVLVALRLRGAPPASTGRVDTLYLDTAYVVTECL